MRTEKDSLGSLQVPDNAYYGIQTLRAKQNFPISGLKLHPVMVTAMVVIKKAAAQTNSLLGRIPQKTATAVIQACDEVLDNKFQDQFIVDVFQMGAGTSFHMNCNEVLANRAEEILGGKKGEYKRVHPNDVVNLGQSTNDVFPTAMRLAVLSLLKDHFFPALSGAENSLRKKAEEFDKILKSGRTHLQDAAPIRLGQEFSAYAESLKKGRIFLERASESLLELGIGGSAVGTGLNTSQKYRGIMIKNLSDLTGFALKKAPDLREAMQSMRPFTEVSGAIHNLAIEMNRICNDLRLLSSGPRTGLAEITLPPVAPGSSIMPGKINPSMLEMMNMVCFQVFGCNTVVSSAARAGQLELNVFMPVIAYDLCFMIEIFANALTQVDLLCFQGIKADPVRCQQYAEKSLGTVTALSPIIGYTNAAEIVKQALTEGKTFIAVIKEKKLLTDEQIKKILDPAWMTEPGSIGKDPDDRGL